MSAVDFSGLPQLSVSERVARGKAARREVPRSSHAAFEPAAHRLDPVELLERQADTRLPELVPIRYGRMLASPFTFYRGAALIMAADLAPTPRTGFIVQCCGDAHLSNFGLYASPERRLVFDINDFDETLPGPWEWDVKRLAVSMLICSRSSGFTVEEQERVVLETVAAYRTWMARFAGMRNLEVWYTRFEIEKLMPQLRSQVGGKMRKRLDKAVAKAFQRDNVQAFSKLSRTVDGERRIVSDPPLIVRLDDFPDSEERDRLKADGERLLVEYSLTLPHERRILLNQFQLVDSARKVVGVGSVGTAAWVALLLGRDTRDPLFLQIKEAQRVGAGGVRRRERVRERRRARRRGAADHAGLERHLPRLAPHPGERLRPGARLLRAPVARLEGVDRRRDDGSAGAERLRAALLGDPRARPRPLRRPDRDRELPRPAAVFDRAVLTFSEAYAEQNDRDFAALEIAAATGRVLADREL